MDVHLILFISDSTMSRMMVKTFHSSIRPIVGDIIEDPGFDPDYHNGYEVVKVAINYATEEIFVSLSPMVPDRAELDTQAYIEKLEANGWRSLTKDELMAEGLTRVNR